MAPFSLSVEQLGKRYRIPAKVAKTELNQVLSAIGLARTRRELWAVRGVSFQVEPGTILGIIGLNGAGKTTLLKVIARVTPPTEGRVVGRGRVVPLLALGHGMRAEMTGRENLYLTAAMYGVPRAEVNARLDDIVSFAGLDNFLDVPVKHYSSGMGLRLAFSTAIHLDPDILLADEVLAVGDVQFQEKCLQRVEEAGTAGMTVMFVSHDMAAIRRLCHRVIWLNAGQVVMDGPPDVVVPQYEKSAWASGAGAGHNVNKNADPRGRILSVQLVNERGELLGAARTCDEVYLRGRFRLEKPGLAFRCVFVVSTDGTRVFRSVQPEDGRLVEPGVFEATAKIPHHLLAARDYSVKFGVWLLEDGKESTIAADNALTFQAMDVDEQAHPILESTGGLLAPRLEWEVKRAHAQD